MLTRVLFKFLAGLLLVLPIHPAAEEGGTGLTNTRELAWGRAEHGLRLRIDLDRQTCLQNKDKVHVSFTIQNIADRNIPITLALTAEERTDLLLTDEQGRSRRIPGYRGMRLATQAEWQIIPPGGIAKVNMALNPEAQGLATGAYRVQGVFRYAGPHTDPMIQQDFQLYSNEVALVISRSGAKPE